MSAYTLRTVAPTIGGATVTAQTGVVSADTVTVAPSTAASCLDMSSLAVRVSNGSSTASITLSLAAGDDFSEKGQGAKSITIATAATVVIGGQGFESARFQDSDGYIVFTQAGAGPATYEAYQQPHSFE